MNEVYVESGVTYIVRDGNRCVPFIWDETHQSVTIGAVKWNLELLAKIGTGTFQTKPHEAIKVFWQDGIRQFKIVRRNLRCVTDDCDREIDPDGDSELCSRCQEKE